MKSYSLGVLLVGVLLVLFAAYYSEKCSKEYFSEHLENKMAKAGSSKTLVLFHAPWCGHCKQLMPTWDKFESENQGGSVDVLKINADDNQEAAKKHGVEGYPTIKFLPNGLDNPEGAVDYQGERTYEGLKKFLQEHSS